MGKGKATAHGWASSTEFRRQAQRLWDRGGLLRSILVDAAVLESVEPPVVFPYRLKFRKPTSRELGEQYSEVRSWMQSLEALRHVRVVTRETRHPVIGRNVLPQEVWLDTVEDAVALIQRSGDVQTFKTLIMSTTANDDRLLAWLYKRPLKAIELSEQWGKLFAVYQSMLVEPSPAIYLRQLSVPGVDTKFIERHRDTLSEWLEIGLPDGPADSGSVGIRGFARRYGFLDKPVRLRMRSLDPCLPLLGTADAPASDFSVQHDGLGSRVVEGSGTSSESSKPVRDKLRTRLATADITLDVQVVRCLRPGHSRVLITENEINYLALPELAGTLAVFGAGYGWQSLARISWLASREVWYWGDIDTHGFAILNELRASVPHVQSILMDQKTLLLHEPLWGQEPTPVHRVLERLSVLEDELYQELAANRYGDRVRLEQEQVDFGYVCRILAARE